METGTRHPETVLTDEAVRSIIDAAFRSDAQLPGLIPDPFFQDRIQRAQPGWRRVATAAVTHGIPFPALTAALCFYDGYRSHTLPANLLQAQRDYFGAHT